MHTYAKKYINNLFTNAVFNDCEVSVIKLTAEDITNLKLKLIKNKGNTPKEDDNTIKDDVNTIKDDDNTLQVDITCNNKQTSKDDKKSKVVKTSKDNNTTTDDGPSKKKQKIDTTGIDVLKLVLSRVGESDQFKSQFKSVLKANKEIASSSTDEVPMIIDCYETTESENPSAKDVKPRIWVIDAKKMMDEINFTKWMKNIHSNSKIPVTPTVLSSINSDKIVQQWFLSKNPDGTYPQIPVSNDNKSQTIGNTGLKHSIVTSQPKNNFCESFSSSIQKNASEPSTSKVIPTKKNFVVTSTISNSPLVQVTASSSESATSTPTPTTSTFVTFKKPIQYTHIVANSPLHRVEGGTIALGNKHYQLVKGPSGQMRAVNGTNILAKSPPTIITKCHVRRCKKSATIMCSSCTSVKYCSELCQHTDWHESHINDCDRLQKNKKTRL